MAQHRVQELFLDRTGMLWISTQNARLFRLDTAEADGSTPAAYHFPKTPAIPEAQGPAR